MIDLNTVKPGDRLTVLRSVWQAVPIGSTVIFCHLELSRGGGANCYREGHPAPSMTNGTPYYHFTADQLELVPQSYQGVPITWDEVAGNLAVIQTPSTCAHTMIPSPLDGRMWCKKCGFKEWDASCPCSPRIWFN